jgi:hypothetical protein
MIFEPFGPFELQRCISGVDQTTKKKFRQDVAKQDRSLPDAVGCYIFAIRAGKGFTPWYVGKTEKQSFQDRIWQGGHFMDFNHVLCGNKGTPVVFLLAWKTRKGNFRKATKRKSSGSISSLEEMLIGTCLQRNSELLNRKLVKYKAMHVPGYLNEKPGARSSEAKALARLLNT